MKIENWESKRFEDIKHLDNDGKEYWNARELQTALGYTEWECFFETMEMAMISCAANDEDPKKHFAAGSCKITDPAEGAQKETEDYRLSRYACHLVALNSGPRRGPVAHGQMYFDDCVSEWEGSL